MIKLGLMNFENYFDSPDALFSLIEEITPWLSDNRRNPETRRKA